MAQSRLLDESGFSLIDVIIGMAIFAVGMLAIGSMQMHTVKNATLGNVISQATMLAHQKMEEVKNSSDITTLVTHTESNLDQNGDSGGIFNRTTTITVPTAPFDQHFRLVEVRVQWRTGHGGDRDIVLNSITHGQGI